MPSGYGQLPGEPSERPEPREEYGFGDPAESRHSIFVPDHEMAAPGESSEGSSYALNDSDLARAEGLASASAGVDSAISGVANITEREVIELRGIVDSQVLSWLEPLLRAYAARGFLVALEQQPVTARMVLGRVVDDEYRIGGTWRPFPGPS